MLVQDIMTRNVVAIDPEMPIGDVYALMEQRSIRHFPILEVASIEHRTGSKSKISKPQPQDVTSRSTETSPTTPTSSRLIGIVSDRDIRGVGSELKKGQAQVTLKDPVRRIMVGPVLTAHPLDPIEESAKLMREHKIGALPVVEGAELVGIVTAIDFLEALVKMTGVHEAATRLEVEVDNRPGALATLARAIGERGVNIASVLTLQRDRDTLAFVLRVNTINGRNLAEELRQSGFSVTWPLDKQAV